VALCVPGDPRLNHFLILFILLFILAHFSFDPIRILRSGFRENVHFWREAGMPDCACRLNASFGLMRCKKKSPTPDPVATIVSEVSAGLKAIVFFDTTDLTNSGTA
jgi:hypothetical protein